MAGWVKLDEGFFLHPKALAAGRDARDLYLAALCWSNQQKTDGVIPAHALPMVASLAGVPDADQAASRLCEVRLWDVHVDGWTVHDFLAYQMSKEDREAWLAKDRDRKRKAREARRSHEMEDSVRVDSVRIPDDVRSIDVDVDVDVDVSSNSSSTDVSEEGYPQPPDDDERLQQTLDLVAQELAATNGRRNPNGYHHTVIAKAPTDGRLTRLKSLLAAHPTRDPIWLADEHLGRAHPPDPNCRRCGEPRHTNGPCPTLLAEDDR